MEQSKIRFPCPVRRIIYSFQNDKWVKESEARVASMTLPPSQPLPTAAGPEGHSGFWYEVADDAGKVLYRFAFSPPDMTHEIFEPDGSMRRVPVKDMPILVEVRVPDVPEARHVTLFSSEPMHQPPVQPHGARKASRRPTGGAAPIATFDLKSDKP